VGIRREPGCEQVVFLAKPKPIRGVDFRPEEPRSRARSLFNFKMGGGKEWEVG